MNERKHDLLGLYPEAWPSKEAADDASRRYVAFMDEKRKRITTDEAVRMNAEFALARASAYDAALARYEKARNRMFEPAWPTAIEWLAFAAVVIILAAVLWRA